MKIKVIPMAVISTDLLDDNSCIEMKEGATVAELLEKLNIQKHHLNFVSVIHNEKKIPFYETLYEGMEVKVFLPVGGG